MGIKHDSVLCCLLFLSLCSCSPECNWNGRYSNNQCHCYAGFKGAHCETNCHCEAHGVCKADNTCDCETGWIWSAVEQKCVWTCKCDAGVKCIGPGECSCVQDCKMGTCRNGQCLCYEGYKGDDCDQYDADILQNKGVNVGINIGGISYYSSEVKWVDVAKQSQEWITERTDDKRWDTGEHDKVQWRPDGYPLRMEASLKLLKLMLRGFGQYEEMGNYTVLYDGEGTLQFSLTENHVLYDGKGRKVINFPHVNDGGILLTLTDTNPTNPIHNIRILPPGYENTYQRFPFHPLFLDFLKRFSEIRFMDYLAINGHSPEPTTWASRMPLNFHTQEGRSGGSIEYIPKLANTLGVNPWVNIPHAADDDYVKQFATLMKQQLRPDLKVYVEYSNEVWNGIFRQTQYTQEKGRSLFPSDPGFKQGMKYFNKRAAEVANIWNQVWASERNRVINVYAWQTGFQDYYRQALEDLGNRTASFDALAITGYFDCDDAAGGKHAKDLPGMTMQEIQHLCDKDLQNQKNSYTHFMDVAKAHGLKLVMYEGGPSVMEGGAIVSGASVQAVADKAIAFNKDLAIQRPMQDILTAWRDIVTQNHSNSNPGGLFNYFSSVGLPSKYGSWGMAEYTGQDLSKVQKWLAVQDYISKNYPNNPLGPKCSFVSVKSTGLAFGCSPSKSDGHYSCAKSTDGGRAWTNLSVLAQDNTHHVTLDGYDPVSEKLFVRVTSRTAVDSYHFYSQKMQQWSILQNFQYYSEVNAPSLLPRFPTDSNHGLDVNLNCK